jgi:hypothetical protein
MFKTCALPGDSLWDAGVFTQRLFGRSFLSSIFPVSVHFFINRVFCTQTSAVYEFPTLSTRNTKKITYLNKLILGGV